MARNPGQVPPPPSLRQLALQLPASTYAAGALEAEFRMFSKERSKVMVVLHLYLHTVTWEILT